MFHGKRKTTFIWLKMYEVKYYICLVVCFNIARQYWYDHWMIQP